VAPFARRTARLHGHLQVDGVALGGEPGARHATADGTAVSAGTPLRLVRALPFPPVGPLGVIGVDDWARRKGHTHGTSSSISNGTGWWTCCPIAPPRRWYPGSLPIRASHS
jgi:hypothetical protein